MTDKAIRELRSRLPKGYRKVISDMTHLSISYIDRVFNCTRKNQLVIDAGLSILETEPDINQLQMERFNRITRASR